MRFAYLPYAHSRSRLRSAHGVSRGCRVDKRSASTSTSRGRRTPNEARGVEGQSRDPVNRCPLSPDPSPTRGEGSTALGRRAERAAKQSVEARRLEQNTGLTARRKSGSRVPAVCRSELARDPQAACRAQAAVEPLSPCGRGVGERGHARGKLGPSPRP